MGKVYRCKEAFILPKYDENGSIMEDEKMIINVGDIFEISKNRLELDRIIPAVKLICTGIHNPIWINVLPETIEKYFEEVDE